MKKSVVLVAAVFILQSSSFAAEAAKTQKPAATKPSTAPAKTAPKDEHGELQKTTEQQQEAKKQEATKKAETEKHVVEEKHERYGKKNGSLEPFEVGPKISIGLPIPPSIGVEAKYNNLFGASFDYAYIPTITVSGYSIGANAWDFNLRYYPFKGAFFIGGNFGVQNLNGSKSDTILTVPVTLSAANSITFLTPHIGWRWVADSGFFWGMELGAQIALNVTTTLTPSDNASALIQSQPEWTTLNNSITDLNNLLRRYPLPLLAFQVGFFF